MNLPTLSARNLLRNKTRTFLTILGVAIAVFAFGFLRTVINAYYIGIEAAANERLVARNQVSFILPLPLAYKDKIARVPGVTRVAAGNWFGGVYKDPKNFFARFAVDSEPFLAMYPEFQLADGQKKAYLEDRTGCVIGSKLAQKFDLKLGDTIPLQGDIFPGQWKFTVRGIYTPRDKATDATQMFFHWKYLDDSVPERRKGQVGFYYVSIADANQSASISKAIDAEFKGSPAETLTESEKAFQMSFLSMVSAVLAALEVISLFVLVVVALILGNTIAMSVRDRSGEVAILKTLGFRGGHLAILITGESMLVGALGGACAVGLALPAIRGVGKVIDENLGGWFPVFQLEPLTIVAMIGLSVGIGFLAALVPAIGVARLGVASAFRRIG